MARPIGGLGRLSINSPLMPRRVRFRPTLRGCAAGEDQVSEDVPQPSAGPRAGGPLAASGRWFRTWLDRAYEVAVGLSFLRLSALIIGLALAGALILATQTWELLYGLRGWPIVIVTVIVAVLTATPLTAFVVYVIRKAADARSALADSNEALVLERIRLIETLEALRAARDEANAANLAKSQFLATVTDELRAPLTTILDFSEMIRTETLGPIGQPQYQQYVAEIHDSGAHLLELIDDILDVSRVEAGGFELNEASEDPGRVVEAMVRLIQPRAEKEGVEIRNAIAVDALPPLFADQRAVKQMVLNLLSNAVKYTPEGGTVTISARLDRRGALLVAVEDTGSGIPAEDVERVLAPFSRLEGSLAEDDHGVGLGLSLTKSLIELHGGTVSIDSMPGQGTTVVLRFPPERVHAPSLAAGA